MNVIPAVEALKSRHGSLPLTERLTGVVRARNQVAIYPEINASIVKVYVKDGQRVRKGQPLVRLRDRAFSERLKQAEASYQIALAQLKQAKARLKEVEAELKRTEHLAARNLASTAELEAVQSQAASAEADLELAEARVEQARATVDERKEALSQTVVRSPVTGIVGNRDAEIGMLVNSNTRLFTVGELDSLHIEVVLTDRMLNYLEEGQRAEIYSENLETGAVSASLSRISPFLHPVTHSTDAEIDIANPANRLKPGMFVTVDIYYGESEQATLVPLSALYEHPATGATGVYVSRDTVRREPVSVNDPDGSVALTAPVAFEFVPVEVLARGRMQAGISGVKSDRWVITLGQDLLAGEDGDARVRPVNWGWVEQLQNLQRQDLLDEIMKKQQVQKDDTLRSNP